MKKSEQLKRNPFKPKGQLFGVFLGLTLEGLYCRSCSLVVGVLGDDAFQEFHRLCQPVCCLQLVQQQPLEVIVGIYDFLVLLDGLVVGSNCLIEPAEIAECKTHVVVGICMLRVNLDGLLVAGHRLLLPAELVECNTHAIVGHCILRVNLDCFFVGLHCLLVPARLIMIVAFIEVLLSGLVVCFENCVFLLLFQLLDLQEQLLFFFLQLLFPHFIFPFFLLPLFLLLYKLLLLALLFCHHFELLPLKSFAKHF